jgi:glycosyltransferase involved in cell wall biosynthesis
LHVLWQTQSRQLRDALAGKTGRPTIGGLAYEYDAAGDLARSVPVAADDRCVREEGEGHVSYIRKIAGRPNNDPDTLYVIDPFVLASGKRTHRGIAISIVHHLDTDLMRSSLPWRVFFAVLVRRLRGLDRVVTVSQFWRHYLEERGCENVVTIYNSFELAEFDELGDPLQFRRDYDLAAGRPLVYIGNARRGKGVEETYQALKDQGYTLVTSGPKDGGLDLPVVHLDLVRRDYLRLLASADVVVAMSTMPEGWNRTVHEAMLCKTPVVGSGSGGMLELLTKGGQFVAESFTLLPDRVRQALAESEERSQTGYTYASTLDATYRCRAWTDLLQTLAPVSAPHGQLR